MKKTLFLSIFLCSTVFAQISRQIVSSGSGSARTSGATKSTTRTGVYTVWEDTEPTGFGWENMNMVLSELEIVHVTTLDSLGSGSLGSAALADSGRYVVFDVEGEISNNGANWINLSQPRIFIDGSTAPGDGITITGRGFNVNADNIVVRYIRVRHADLGGASGNSFLVDGGVGDSTRNVIIDKCSFAWGVDDNGQMSAWCRNITVQNCLLFEGRNAANTHPDSPGHSFGMGVSSRNTTIYNNVFAHNAGRVPKINLYRQDMINNLVYNSNGNNFTQLTVSVDANVINNNWIDGDDSSFSSLNGMVHFSDSTDLSKAYLSGNIQTPDSLNYGADQWNLAVLYQDGTDQVYPCPDTLKADSQIGTLSVDAWLIRSASSLENALLNGAVGVTPYDTVDVRIIAEIKGRTGSIGKAGE